MPLRELIQALDPPPPDAVLQAANALRYRDYLTVVLVVNRESIFPDNWIYIHSPEVTMGRIQNYKNWSPHMVPDPSQTALGLEYFLWDKDEEWQWSNERLIELGIRECAQIGLVQPREVTDGTVVRMKKAYPVYDQAYQESLPIVRKYLETFSNFQTIGRNGLHRYNNQDHSMLTGVYAARNIVGEKLDVWSVNTDMEYHEETRAVEATGGDRLVPTRIQPAQGEPQVLPEEIIDAVFARLDPVAFGISVGLVSGSGIFLATVALLLQGGPVVGPNFSLLGNYLPGFKVTWAGAFLGLVEGGSVGFVLGNMIAGIRNWGMKAYAYLVKQQSENKTQSDLLDKL
jgi:hypothetical protein